MARSANDARVGGRGLGEGRQTRTRSSHRLYDCECTTAPEHLTARYTVCRFHGAVGASLGAAAFRVIFCLIPLWRPSVQVSAYRI
jgi:hypothetical protein